MEMQRSEFTHERDQLVLIERENVLPASSGSDSENPQRETDLLGTSQQQYPSPLRPAAIDEQRVLQELSTTTAGNTLNIPHSKAKTKLAPPQTQHVSQQPVPAEPTAKPEQQQLCLVHNKVRDIVCTVDLEIVCSNCAIFCHKGHDFKSLKDFQLDKLKHCQMLLELTDGRKKLQEEISGDKALQKNHLQFQQLRGKLLKQIHGKFATLVAAVRQAEERCVQRISKSLNQEEERIKNLMIVPPPISQASRKWETTAHDHMNSFDTKQVRLQMCILNYDGKGHDDTINRGEQLLQSLKKYQALLQQKTSNSFSSFALQFDTEIEKKLATIHQTFLRKFKKQVLPQNVEDLSIALDQNQSMNTSVFNQTVMLDDLLLDDKQRDTEDNQKSMMNINHQQPSTFYLPTRNGRQISVLGMSDATDSLSTIYLGKGVNPVCPATLRLPGSPTKQFALPSPRCFVSPNKFKFEPNIDNKLKKVLIKLKLPEKYYKLVASAISEPMEVFDLTNCGLDEHTILAVLQLIRNNRSIKVMKLIRNRLADEFIAAALPHLTHTMVLNLSQNFLTDRTLQLLAGGISQLPSLRTVILTQNRIRERNWRQRVDEFRRLNIGIVL